MSEDIGMAINAVVTLKMRNYKRYLGSIDICEGYNSVNNQYILKNVYSAEPDSSFVALEKERLINYSKEKFNLDEIQTGILKEKDWKR